MQLLIKSHKAFFKSGKLNCRFALCTIKCGREWQFVKKNMLKLQKWFNVCILLILVRDDSQFLVSHDEGPRYHKHPTSRTFFFNDVFKLTIFLLTISVEHFCYLSKNYCIRGFSHIVFRFNLEIGWDRECKEERESI